MSNQPSMILASSSPSRARALAALGLPFDTRTPAIDESRSGDESAEHLSIRLGLAKAHKVQSECPESIIIGSDQVGICGDQFLGKPATADNAHHQLQQLSGQRARFFTSLAVVAPDRRPWTACTTTTLKFRSFDSETAKAYVALDQPLGCAGSFKAEALGIALFEWIRSDDPTALIGLPMIELVSALHHFGVTPILPQH